MTISAVHCYPYRLPFQQGFSTAHGVLTARTGAIVEVRTTEGISGFGEIAPPPEAYERGESQGRGTSQGRRKTYPYDGRAGMVVGTKERAHLSALAEQLRGRSLDDALEIIDAALIEERNADHSLYCGLEIALLDALGKVEDCSVSGLLCAGNRTARPGVPVNGVVGASGIQAAVCAAREAREKGFACVKLKVGLGGNCEAEVERIAAVRKALGPSIHLRLDANEAWNLEQALAILSRCVQYNIQYVEQPLKANDLAGMAALRRAVPIAIAADEAVCSLGNAQQVLACEAADVLVIKPQVVGGLRVGQRIIQAASACNVQCVITSNLEAGMGVTAALHLAAASPALTLECGLATLHLLIDDLLIDDLPLHAGVLEVPAGPGLGVSLDREALHRYNDERAESII